MGVSVGAHKPGLNPHWHLSLTVPRQYSYLSLNNCLFVSVCLCVFVTIYIHVVSLSWFCAVRVAVCCVCCVSCMNSFLLSFKAFGTSFISFHGRH